MLLYAQCVHVALHGQATEIAVSEQFDVDINFDYVDNTVDSMMSSSLLGSGFTVEVHNVTTSDGIEEVNTFRSFIPTTFTQLEYSHYVQEVNHIATSNSGSTVIDDFNRIGQVTAMHVY